MYCKNYLENISKTRNISNTGKIYCFIERKKLIVQKFIVFLLNYKQKYYRIIWKGGHKET